MITVTRVVSQVDYNYKILCAGKDFDIGKGMDVAFQYGSSIYNVTMHNSTAGRISKLTKWYKENNIQEGMEILLSYDPDQKCIIASPGKELSSQNTFNGEDEFDDDIESIALANIAGSVNKSIEIGDNEHRKVSLVEHNLSRKEISFSLVDGNVWLSKESYRYQGEQRFRYVVKSSGNARFSFEESYYTQEIIASWLFKGFLWMVCSYDDAYHLCKIKENGRKVKEVCEIKEKTGWTEKQCRLYTLPDDSLLLQMGDTVHFIGSWNNKVLNCGDNNNRIYDPLCYIECVNENKPDEDWFLLWGREQRATDDIRWIYHNGKTVNIVDFIGKRRRDAIISLLKNRLKDHYPEYLKKDLKSDMNVLFLVESHLFQITFWHQYMNQAQSIYREDVEEIYDDIEEQRFYLSQDGTCLYDENMSEIDENDIEIESKHTHMPDYVKQVIDLLYVYYIMEAYKIGVITLRPSLKKIEENVLTWYDYSDFGEEGDVAIFLRNKISQSGKQKYYVCKDRDKEGNLCIRRARVKEKLHTESAEILKINSKFPYVLYTEQFLNKPDIYFRDLADVLTTYLQLQIFEKGDLHPMKHVVEPLEIADKTYAVFFYKENQYICFFADLSEYGFDKRAVIKNNLSSGEIYLGENKEYVLLPKVELPNPQIVAHIVPTKKMQIFSSPDSKAEIQIDNPKRGLFGKKNNMVIAHVIDDGGSGMLDEQTESFNAEAYIYDDISVYIRVGKGWVKHPVFRHLKALELMDNGVIYANDDGVSFMDVSGRNHIISNEKNVVDMRVVGKTLVLQTFVKLAGPYISTFLYMDMWDMTQEYYQIVTSRIEVDI